MRDILERAFWRRHHELRKLIRDTDTDRKGRMFAIKVTSAFRIPRLRSPASLNDQTRIIRLAVTVSGPLETRSRASRSDRKPERRPRGEGQAEIAGFRWFRGWWNQGESSAANSKMIPKTRSRSLGRWSRKKVQVPSPLQEGGSEHPALPVPRFAARVPLAVHLPRMD